MLASYRARVPLPDDVAVGRRPAARAAASSPAIVPPGHRPRAACTRCPASSARTTSLLALGRTNPLKNFPLTRDALARRCPRPRPQLWLFGIEPELGERARRALLRAAERRRGQRAAQPRHRVRPDLAPRGLLPAAARGDGGGRAGRLHGRPRQPRLLPRRRELPDGRTTTRTRWRAAIERLFGDAELRARLAEAGRRTAAEYELAGSSTRSSASSPRSRAQRRGRRSLRPHRRVVAQPSRATVQYSQQAEPATRCDRAATTCGWRTCTTGPRCTVQRAEASSTSRESDSSSSARRALAVVGPDGRSACARTSGSGPRGSRRGRVEVAATIRAVVVGGSARGSASSVRTLTGRACR